MPSPSPDLGAYFSLLRALSGQERRFVRAVLSGVSHEDAAKLAKVRGEFPTLRMLGRPQVQAALRTLAPLLPDAKTGLQALAPLLRQRLAEASQKSALGLSAIRDLLTMTAGRGGAAAGRGGGGVGDGLAAEEWARRQRERAALSGSSRLPTLREAEELLPDEGTIVDPSPGPREAVALVVDEPEPMPPEERAEYERPQFPPGARAPRRAKG